MTLKRKKQKVKVKTQIKNKSSFSKLASITTNSLGNAYSKYKKKLEKKKIKEIKLKIWADFRKFKGYPLQFVFNN